MVGYRRRRGRRMPVRHIGTFFFVLSFRQRNVVKKIGKKKDVISSLKSEFQKKN